jgi:hypothetical protein
MDRHEVRQGFPAGAIAGAGSPRKAFYKQTVISRSVGLSWYTGLTAHASSAPLLPTASLAAAAWLRAVVRHDLWFRGRPGDQSHFVFSPGRRRVVRSRRRRMVGARPAAYRRSQSGPGCRGGRVARVACVVLARRAVGRASHALAAVRGLRCARHDRLGHPDRFAEDYHQRSVPLGRCRVRWTPALHGIVRCTAGRLCPGTMLSGCALRVGLCVVSVLLRVATPFRARRTSGARGCSRRRLRFRDRPTSARCTLSIA